MNKYWPVQQQYPYYPTPPPFPSAGYYYNPYLKMPIESKPITAEANESNKKPQEQETNDQQLSKDVTIYEHLNKLYEKLSKMEEENQKLKEKVENIKPITIENINYKIQDLSVQDLSGTLLVGLSALSDAEELKKLLSENGPVTFNDINTEDLADESGNENESDQQVESN